MLPSPDNLINPICWIGYVLLFTVGLINPTVLAWLSDVSLATCEPSNSPYPLCNDVQLVGGSVAKRLRSALAYGWVEHCSDVAGCGTNFFQDKYFCLC